MEKHSEETKSKNIDFLLENWDMLNMKEINKLYANGGVF